MFCIFIHRPLAKMGTLAETNNMKIENCTINDIDEIFRLYKIASEYQSQNKR